MDDARSGARQRAEAARAVHAVVADGRSLDAALAASDERLGARERPLVHLLAFGALRHHWRLRWQLRQLVDRPLKPRDRIVESLLAVGLYQLGDTRVPDHAAVSMTVEAARLLRRPKFAGLINAVLRNFLRRKLQDGEPGDDEARFDHPGWLLARLREDWPDDWAAITAANTRRAPMWIRVNARFGSAASYLAETGIDGDLHPALPQAVRLQKPCPVDGLPGFAEGRVSVQDAAAQLAAPWLIGDGGGRILDACAAPGGKTGHLLELMADRDDLTAIDADPARLAAVTATLERLGRHATVQAADASNPEEWWDGRYFDRILLDAPCSGTGVIRRHPDIKLLRRDADIEALAAGQGSLLRALWSVLKPGGRLLYVTCSVLAAENGAVVGDFLAARPDARHRSLLQDYNIRDLMCEKAIGCQVLPGIGDFDGFYFASLEKTTPAAETKEQ